MASATPRQASGSVAVPASSATPASKPAMAGSASKMKQAATSATSSAEGSALSTQSSSLVLMRSKYSSITISTALWAVAGSGRSARNEARARSAGRWPEAARRSWRELPSQAPRVRHMSPRAWLSPPRTRLAAERGVPAEQPNHSSKRSSNLSGSTSRSMMAGGRAGMRSPDAATLRGGVRGASPEAVEAAVVTVEAVDSASLRSSQPSSSSRGASLVSRRRAASKSSSHRRASSGLSAARRHTRKPKSSSSSWR
mmetsp:Transcript_94295/g.266265  ORF Transcript_94295/g.266265 Transcript_94295/m.266265 type:complete len:255 (+) Transcript_94295:1423-2187(+)